ncbi:MAG: glutamate racemase [Spirochaetota bacterium]
MDNRPIGIFDSGVGGLTVCKAVRDLLPGENIIYFGDTMRFPYGTRSIDTVVRYSREIVSYFRSRDVKMVVCACNTASAAALPLLAAENDIPVIGVIQAGARAACSRSNNGKIGVIATRATVKSGAYINAIHELRPEISVIQQHATLFVSLVEEGFTDHEMSRLAAKEYLQKMYGSGIRTLILGCTHFPLLKDCIHSVYNDIELIDSGLEIAREVCRILAEKNLANPGTDGNIELYASDITETILNLKEMFFGKNGAKLEQFIISGKI